MTEAAQTYFKTYYKLERMKDENINDPAQEASLKKILREAYDTMTEREREILDIVGKDNIKE